MHPVVVLQLLILLMLANGTPVIAKKMFGGHYSYPLDGNLTFADGRPVFGPLENDTRRRACHAGHDGGVVPHRPWLENRPFGRQLRHGRRPPFELLQTTSRAALEQPGERSRPDSGIASTVARVP